MPELIVDQLTCSLGGTTVVSGASCTLKAGMLTVLLGPNGAGKTSFVRASMGLIGKDNGSAKINDVDTSTLKPRERARLISYLPQQRSLAWPLTVRDVVTLGRFAHSAGPFFKLRDDEDPKDVAAVDNAIDACDLRALEQRRTDCLSGGELSRVHCARALAAQTPILIADEPTAALDPRHAFQIMDIIADYVRRGGAALIIMHDLALAARYATHLLWMRDGKLRAQGPVESSFTEQLCADVYGVQAQIDGASVVIKGSL